MTATKTKPPASGDSTGELILTAAGRIFAEQGFHSTTVRQITREAGANLAAVNYHFRDKHELYVCALKRAHQTAARMEKVDFSGTPREQLRLFIRTFLEHLLDPRRPEWHGRLMAREMMEPTPALDRLVKESIQPVKERMGRIVGALLGPGVPEATLRLCCFSILGQCLYYVHCREMITRLFPDERRIHRDVEALTGHIYQFSLAGLTAARSQNKRRGKSRRKGTS